MKIYFLAFLIALPFLSCVTKKSDKIHQSQPNLELTHEVLKDKIKGGWAGQVIGVTYGGPTEFRWNGTMINSYNKIPWSEDECVWWYENVPGLYDDVYMDLTFVEVFEKHGFDTPADVHAKAFAYAEYPLWHANQVGRYNIRNGIMPPASGHWHNNPHADDIDFQIEADFIGLMTPGMVNQGSEIADKIGHIMNYGDGYYGGVYVAAMYSLAFIYDDIDMIVKEALRVIPKESTFYQCMNDVIQWKQQYPYDWEQCWFEVQRKWSSDIGCPDGVFSAFNIDAKVNCAYVLIGLLYGDQDYTKTIDISTRCGLDSDCNPATAAGILGTMVGYSNIPEYWKKPIYKVEDRKFEYTNYSLNDIYKIGYKHAIAMLEKNKHLVEDSKIVIKEEVIETVPLEIAFKDHYPTERTKVSQTLDAKNRSTEINFTGNSFVLRGFAQSADSKKFGKDIKLIVEIDDFEKEIVMLPTDPALRRHDIAWKYELPDGEHHVKLTIDFIEKDDKLLLNDLLVYEIRKN